jgi:hypothetical protein
VGRTLKYAALSGGSVWVGLGSFLGRTLLPLTNHCLQALQEFRKAESFVLSLSLAADDLHFEFGEFGNLHGRNVHSVFFNYLVQHASLSLM